MVREYPVLVWFATAAAPRRVAVRSNISDARAEASRYLGADARGVWIQFPNGDYEDQTGRGFAAWLDTESR